MTVSTRAFLIVGVAAAALLASPALAQTSVPGDANSASESTQAQSDGDVATEPGAAGERNISDIVVTAPAQGQKWRVPCP